MMIHITLWMAVLAAAWTTPPPANPDKLSLLVGVSTYLPASKWKQLHAGNDLDLLQEVLTKNSFRVQRLEDEKATKKGILDTLKLISSNIAKGAVFHFHFSGHGQQVADVSGDEFDGLDEALVPYDAPDFYNEYGYRGENHLLDDELGEALDAIRLKVGPTGQVLVTLDACHAGTATRGLSTCRGTDVVMAPPDFKVNEDAVLNETSMMEIGRDAGMSPVTVFAASSAQQPNWEYPADNGKQYGPLSYALSKVLINNAPEQATYRAIFDKIRAEMAVIAPQQTPRAEGALNLSLGNNTVKQTAIPHYTVAYAPTKSEVKINGGLLLNLHEGTLLAFYPPDTWQPEPGKAFAKGRITHAGLTISDVELLAPANKKDLTAAWVYVEEQNIGSARLGIKLQLPNNRELEEELNLHLAEYPVIKQVEKGFDLLITESEDGKIRVITRDDVVLYEDYLTLASADAAYLAEEIIVKNTQSHFLKKLEYTDPWLKVRLEIVPIAPAEPDVSNTSAFKELTMKDGDEFYIEAVNEGKKGCYLNLINIRPDLEIKSLLPGASNRYEPDDLYLPPGKRRRLKNEHGTYTWKAEAPYGLDMLKLIATEEMADLRLMLKTRGRGEESNPVVRALAGAYSLRSRSYEEGNLPGGAAAVTSLVLRIER